VSNKWGAALFHICVLHTRSDFEIKPSLEEAWLHIQVAAPSLWQDGPGRSKRPSHMVPWPAHSTDSPTTKPPQCSKSFWPAMTPTGHTVPAHLCSIACRPGATWLVHISDGVLRAALRRRPAEPNVPPGTPNATCFCRSRDIAPHRH
jgi:hypothetical protein